MKTRFAIALLALPVVFAAACGDDEEPATRRTPGGDATGEPTEIRGESESVFELEVGDCFNDDDDLSAEATEVEVIDCELPHDNEIFFEYSLEDGDFPGAETMLEDTLERCVDEFEGFVGTAYEDSDLDVFPIYPTDESWAEGDRVVYCALYAVDLSKLTGSMEGARR